MNHHRHPLALLLALLLPACAIPEPDNANARAFSGYQPLCLLLCFSTGEATQAENGAATSGAFTNEHRNSLGGSTRAKEDQK